LLMVFQVFHFYTRNKVEHVKHAHYQYVSHFNKLSHLSKYLIINCFKFSVFKYVPVTHLFSTCFILIGEFLPHITTIIIDKTGKMMVRHEGGADYTNKGFMGYMEGWEVRGGCWRKLVHPTVASIKRLARMEIYIGFGRRRESIWLHKSDNCCLLVWFLRCFSTSH
jgi:hypothetical protein